MNSMMDTVEYFCQMSSKFILTISSSTIAKFMHFFLRHSVYYSIAAETRQVQVEHIQMIQIHPRTVCKHAHPH